MWAGGPPLLVGSGVLRVTSRGIRTNGVGAGATGATGADDELSDTDAGTAVSSDEPQLPISSKKKRLVGSPDKKKEKETYSRKPHFATNATKRDIQ